MINNLITLKDCCFNIPNWFIMHNTNASIRYANNRNGKIVTIRLGDKIVDVEDKRTKRFKWKSLTELKGIMNAVCTAN